MAAAQSTRNMPTPRKRSWPPLLIAGGVVVLLAAITTIVTPFIQGGSMTKEQIAMERYLEEKYGTDFTVNRPELTGAGLGVDGVWEATAHPTSDDSLTFSVGGSQNLDYMSDQYIAALWSREQTQKVQQDVTKIYGSDSTTNVAIKIIFSRDLVKDATLRSPTYDEAKIKYADRGFYYEYIITAPSHTDSSTEADRIFKLIELARNDGIAKIGLSYTEQIRGVSYTCHMGSSKIAATKDALTIEDCLDNKTRED